jgi:hypothetical protein
MEGEEDNEEEHPSSHPKHSKIKHILQQQITTPTPDNLQHNNYLHLQETHQTMTMIGTISHFKYC